MAKSKRETAQQISDEKVAKIRADIARWSAGLWAQEVAPGPACACGLTRADGPVKQCHRHRKEQDADQY